MKKLLLSKCFLALICLDLIISNVVYVGAWEIIFSVGKDGNDRKMLERKEFQVKPDKAISTFHAFSCVGNDYNSISVLYVARTDANPKTQPGKDYHVSLVHGGPAKSSSAYATVGITALPGTEVLNFELQCIHVD